MKRRIAVVVAGVLSLWGLGGTAQAYTGPLEIASILVSPTDVVEIIDFLTRKDSSTDLQIKVGCTVRQSKLLVARTRMDVVLKRSSWNWRGRVFCTLTVPTDVSYTVDLSKIRPVDVRIDAVHRLVVVTMPTPAVEDVTPLLPQLKIDNTFKQGRCKLFDSDVTRELQNVMLKEDFLCRARLTGQEQIPEIRKEGCESLRAFLQRLLEAVKPGVKVVVE